MTQTNELKLLIFDLDGTLVDSRRDIIFCVNLSLAAHGLRSFDETQITQFIGRGSHYLFGQLLAGSMSPHQIDELVDSFKKFYFKHLLDHTKLYAGVLETLSHFSHIPKVIVTNKSQIFADRLVEELNLKNHFEGVFGSEAFTKQKPDPEPIKEVCRRWRVAPHQAAIIGDSENDILAGRGAGALTIAALYGFTDSTILKTHQPDFSISSMIELMNPCLVKKV